MTELKPCPFCGGAPTLHKSMRGYRAGVECESCGIGGPFFADISYPDDDEREVIEEWNRRASQDMDEAHSCSYFCDRPACVKAQRDELRDRTERAGFVMVPPKDSEQLRLAVRAVKQTLFSGGSSVALPADSWIERAFIAGMLAAAPPIEALEGGKTDGPAAGQQQNGPEGPSLTR